MKCYKPGKCSNTHISGTIIIGDWSNLLNTPCVVCFLLPISDIACACQICFELVSRNTVKGTRASVQKIGNHLTE